MFTPFSQNNNIIDNSNTITPRHKTRNDKRNEEGRRVTDRSPMTEKPVSIRLPQMSTPAV